MNTRLRFGYFLAACSFVSLIACDGGGDDDKSSDGGGSADESGGGEEGESASQNSDSTDDSDAEGGQTNGDEANDEAGEAGEGAEGAEGDEAEEGEEGDTDQEEPEDGFINAKVDGEDLNGTYSAAAAAFSGNRIQLTASVGDMAGLGSHVWTIQVPNEAKTYKCEDETDPLYVSLAQADPFAAYDNNDSKTCTITLSQAGLEVGDFVEGTFSATLTNVSDENESIVVTEGEFRVQRAQ